MLPFALTVLLLSPSSGLASPPSQKQQHLSAAVPRTIAANATAPHRLPACAQACEVRILSEYSCDIPDQCYCGSASDSVLHELTSCVQTTCPKLAHLLQWQKSRAAACGLKPRDNNLTCWVVAYALFALAAVSVAARLLSRWRWLGGPGFWWDDWLVLVLFFTTIESLVGVDFGLVHGAGRDSLTLSVADIHRILTWCYAGEFSYFAGTYGSKLAMVLLYLRMWEAKSWFRRICWIVASMLLVTILAFGIGSIIVSWPRHYYVGDSAIVRRKARGVDPIPILYLTGALNVAFDFVVLLLPIPNLMSLQGVTCGRKIAICVAFLFGFIVTACSIVRMVYIAPLKNSTNASWDFGHLATWSFVEMHTSMVCINIPTVTGLARRYWHRISQWNRRREHRPRDPSPRHTDIVASKDPQADVERGISPGPAV